MKSMLASAAIAATVAASTAHTNYPSAVTHGMGDSCFNGGMKQITALIGNVSHQYAVCVPTGNNVVSDTANGFFMTMNKNVDVFAEKVRADPKLKDGFNCVGFSQGNSLCRGYIQRYNDPPVITFLSVHGTVSGVAGFPNCAPSGLLGPVCRTLAHLTGDLAYGGLQNDIFQVDYFRDPFSINTTAYKTKSELAQWNNEGLTPNATINKLFNTTKRYVMIKALKDTMIYPNEGEWWGHYADDSLKTLLTMKETRWYKDDMFGLRTVDERGGILFNTTDGNHLQFSLEQMTWWVDHYFVE